MSQGMMGLHKELMTKWNVSAALEQSHSSKDSVAFQGQVTVVNMK
jgi:hypothetical protein